MMLRHAKPWNCVFSPLSAAFMATAVLLFLPLALLPAVAQPMSEGAGLDLQRAPAGSISVGVLGDTLDLPIGEQFEFLQLFLDPDSSMPEVDLVFIDSVDELYRLLPGEVAQLNELARSGVPIVFAGAEQQLISALGLPAPEDGPQPGILHVLRILPDGSIRRTHLSEPRLVKRKTDDLPLVERSHQGVQPLAPPATEPTKPLEPPPSSLPDELAFAPSTLHDALGRAATDGPDADPGGSPRGRDGPYYNHWYQIAPPHDWIWELSWDGQIACNVTLTAFFHKVEDSFPDWDWYLLDVRLHHELPVDIPYVENFPYLPFTDGWIGWYIMDRYLKISNAGGSSTYLEDYGPGATADDQQGTINIGFDISTEPGIHAGYSQTWDKPCVKIHDCSSLASRRGCWREEFRCPRATYGLYPFVDWPCAFSKGSYEGWFACIYRTTNLTQGVDLTLDLSPHVDVEETWLTEGPFAVNDYLYNNFATISLSRYGFTLGGQPNVHLQYNNAPDPPSTPSGQGNAWVNTSYSYSTSGHDKDGDLLQYKFHWDDGTESPWNGASQSKTWTTPGDYHIYVWAKDSPHGEEGADSESKLVEVDALDHLEISGPTQVCCGASASYYCDAWFFQGGSQQDVSAQWAVIDGNECASIDASGVLTTVCISEACYVTIRATYTDHGVTKSDTFAVTVPDCYDPELCVSPTDLYPEWDGCGPPFPSDTFKVWNCGDESPMDYTINWDAAWIDDCHPDSGQSSGEQDEITVSYDCSGLAPDTYPGTITVTAPGADGSPQHIDVYLTVDDCISTWCRDWDSDDYGDPDDCVQAETPPPGYVADNTDCDDTNPDVNPGEDEICNGIDDDCDQVADPEGSGGCVTYYRDVDDDGYGLSDDSKCLCVPNGFYRATEGGDCNDDDPDVNPDAPEMCNGIDDNCDNQIDESCDLSINEVWISSEPDDWNKECVGLRLPWQEYYVHCSYKWEGPEPAGHHIVRFRIKRLIGIEVLNCVVEQESLEPGEAKVCCPTPWTAHIGFFKLTVTVDADEEVPEYTDGNNQIAVVFSVPGWNVTDLGVLPGTDYSRGWDINDAGQAVGYCCTYTTSEGFKWENDVMTGLEPLPGYSDSRAYGVNGSGNPVGASGVFTVFPPATRATLWVSSPPLDLGTLGGDHSAAYAVNNALAVVGWAETGETEPEWPYLPIRHAFVKEHQLAMTDLGTLGGWHSETLSINESGYVVGWAQNVDGDKHGFAVVPDNGVWYRDDNYDGINDLMIDLGEGEARDVNSSGVVVGACVSSGMEPLAATWTPESRDKAVGFNRDVVVVLGAIESYARGINDHGMIVGSAKTEAGTDFAFLYDGCEGRDLNSMLASGTGWELTSARSINNEGKIAGNGKLDDESRAFILDLDDWPDCNGNGVADEWDIGTGTSQDCNGNAMPDECDLPGDFDGSGTVDAPDVETFVETILWDNPGCATLADLNGDGEINGLDVQPFVSTLLTSP